MPSAALTMANFRRTLASVPTSFSGAFAWVWQLVADFRANEKFHQSLAYRCDGLWRVPLPGGVIDFLLVSQPLRDGFKEAVIERRGMFGAPGVTPYPPDGPRLVSGNSQFSRAQQGCIKGQKLKPPHTTESKFLGVLSQDRVGAIGAA